MAQWRGKEWCFTINAPKGSEEEDAEEFLQPFYETCCTLECRYLAVKGEVGDEGNYHLQGFVIFLEDKNFKNIKEIFGCGSMHLEKRSKRSTDIQAAKYVKKEETTWGLFPLFEIGSLEEKKRCPELPRGAFREEHFKKCQECFDFRVKEMTEFDEFLKRTDTPMGI